MLKRTVNLTRDEIETIIQALETHIIINQEWGAEPLKDKFLEQWEKIVTKEKMMFRLQDITPRDPESH